MRMSLYHFWGGDLTLFIDSDILIGDRKLQGENGLGEMKPIQTLL